MPPISMLASVLNPPELTANFLFSASEVLKDDEVELVIVCDGETNVRTHRLLRDTQSGSSRIRVIFHDLSRGYAIANNVAASEARGKVLVFLNFDRFPANNAVRILAHFRMYLDHP
jgi:GT2 family glycosyltransferase